MGKAEAAKAVAMPFVQAILRGNATAAYPELSGELGNKVSDQAFADFVKSLAFHAPYSAPSIEHVYRVSLRGGAPQPVMCGTLSNPNEWISAISIPAPEQFHIVFTSRSRNNDWAINVWMIPSAQGWKVQGFYVGMQSTGGRDAQQLLAAARAQRAQGHAFNATLLYATLPVLINRGDGFQLGLSEEIARDRQTFVRPAELSGKPPFAVLWAARKFSIDQIAVVGIDQNLYLTINYTDSTWDGTNDKEADALNRILIQAFRVAHPEYTEVFGGVVARLYRPDRSGGYSTVFDEKSGFAK